jgi:hypothetical protein
LTLQNSTKLSVLNMFEIMAVHCSGTHFTVQIVGGCRDFIVIFLGLRNLGLQCWDCSFRFPRLEGFLGLGGFRLIAEIWRSVFPDLLTLLCFAFCLVMVVAEMSGTVDLVEKSTDTFVVQTCDEEKSCRDFQIGTSDVMRALQAANLVYVCHSYLFAYLQRASSTLLLHLNFSCFWMASCNHDKPRKVAEY